MSSSLQPPNPQSQFESQSHSQPQSHSQSHHQVQSKANSRNKPPVPYPTNDTQARPTTIKRRKVAKACLFCKRSHMTCDDSRPCTRCLKRDIGHLCCDEPPSAAQRSGGLLSNLSPRPPSASQPAQPMSPNLYLPSTSSQIFNHSINSVSIGKGPIEINSLHSPIDPFIHPINSLSQFSSLFSPTPSHLTLNHAYDPSSEFFPASNRVQSFEETPTPHDPPDHLGNALFESSRMTPEPRGQEPLFDMNEFINACPGLCAHSSHNPNLISSSGIFDQDTVSPAAIHEDRFLVPPLHPQASEPKPDRLEEIIRSSGIEAFDYLQSEQETTEWINLKLHEPSKGKMHALWQESQNLFSTVAHQKNPEHSIESEYQFKRHLITCLPILDTLPIPGCIWRRTGEIYKINEQFYNLIGMRSFASSSILSFLTRENNSKFIKIHQLWDVDSCLNFTEKFNRIALDEGQKAVLTSCVLYRFKEKENVQTRQDTKKQSTVSSCSSSISSPTQGENNKLGKSHRPKVDNTRRSEDSAKEPDNSERESHLNTDDKTTELNYSGKSMVVCDRINCTFSFTVRRDSFGLPCLVIGNFLPS